MPGGVQLGSMDYGKISRTAERRIQAALRQDVTMSIDLEAPAASTSKRGAVLGMSAKSRSRMVRTLCAVDYSLIAGDGTDPAMVTLTMPHDWQSIAPTPTHFKKMVNKFRARYEAAWGHAMPGIWKMEFQFRQQCEANGCHDPRAPHLHILTSVPQGVAPRPLAPDEAAHIRGCHRDDCAHSGHFREDMKFEQWLSHTWARSVAHPDPVEFKKHLGAGTNVSREDTLRYADAKRIAVYFTKHGTFENKAYQNDLPEIWRSAIVDDMAAGANYWGRWVVPVVRAIQETDASLIMHISRHLRKVQRSAGYVRTTSVWRLNTSTGEFRRRKVRRRVKYMRSHRGFLSVNDGVATARDIARIVQYYAEQRDWFDAPPPDAMVPRTGREAHEQYLARFPE